MRATDVKKYINSLGYEPKHDVKAMAKAFRTLSKRLRVSSEDLMRFILSNEPMEGVYTHSYGFHTGAGREIINQFEAEYYENI